MGYANLVSCDFSGVEVCLSIVGLVKYWTGLGSLPLQVDAFRVGNYYLIECYRKNTLESIILLYRWRVLIIFFVCN